MSKISTCLWFNGQAEEAAKFYTSLFKNSKMGTVARYDKATAAVSGQKEGSAMTANFEIEGLKVMGLNGGPDFKFTPAFSISVTCKDEKEIDDLWQKITKDGGPILFELKKYPWSEKYGWCTDRFGLSWQLMLGESPQKIMPALLFTGNLYGRGEEAIQFYTSQFKNSKIDSIFRDPKTNTVMYANFTLNNRSFVLMEGDKSEGAHSISLALSIVVNCQTQDEIDQYWKNLSANGGAEIECGWLTDKFGVAWQIVPEIMEEFMSSSSAKKSEAVMKAMLKMKKLDIQKLKQAYMEA